jgi:hypothetical protein
LTPAKDQPPASTLLTIAPNEFTYTSQGQVKDFTVTNLGPGPSTSLHTALLGGNASPSEFVVNPGGDNCVTKSLVSGDNCTISVQHFGDVGAHHDSFLTVSSDNSQQGGIAAHLIGH